MPLYKVVVFYTDTITGAATQNVFHANAASEAAAEAAFRTGYFPLWQQVANTAWYLARLSVADPLAYRNVFTREYAPATYPGLNAGTSMPSATSFYLNVQAGPGQGGSIYQFRGCTKADVTDDKFLPVNPLDSQNLLSWIVGNTVKYRAVAGAHFPAGTFTYLGGYVAPAISRRLVGRPSLESKQFRSN